MCSPDLGKWGEAPKGAKLWQISCKGEYKTWTGWKEDWGGGG
jgi:hypothetical protein